GMRGPAEHWRWTRSSARAPLTAGRLQPQAQAAPSRASAHTVAGRIGQKVKVAVSSRRIERVTTGWDLMRRSRFWPKPRVAAPLRFELKPYEAFPWTESWSCAMTCWGVGTPGLRVSPPRRV